MSESKSGGRRWLPRLFTPQGISDFTHGRPTESRNPPGLMVAPAWGGSDEIGFSGNYSNYAKEAFGKNEIVFACVRETATSIAEMAFRAWEVGPHSRIAPPLHPLRKLFNKPNPLVSSEYEFWEESATHYELGGEAFIFRARGQDGVTRELWPIRPDHVWHVMSKSAQGHPVKHWLYKPDPNKPGVPMDTADVIHLRMPNPIDPIRGISPISVAARSIDGDNRATDYVGNVMKNQGVPAGALMIDREYDPELQKRILKQWQSRHAGPTRSGRVMVLWADVAYQQFAVTPRQMEFPDLRAISETRIAMVLGVPPILIGAWSGLQRSTFSNYSEARRSFYDEKVLPTSSKFADAIMASFTQAGDPDIKGLNLENIEGGFDRSMVRALQEDESVRWNRVMNGMKIGLLGKRQAQEMLGIAPTDPDDIVLVPTWTEPTIEDELSELNIIVEEPTPLPPVKDKDKQDSEDEADNAAAAKNSKSARRRRR